MSSFSPMFLILVLLESGFLFSSGNSYPVQFYDPKVIRNLYCRVLPMSLLEDEALLQDTFVRLWSKARTLSKLKRLKNVHCKVSHNSSSEWNCQGNLIISLALKGSLKL